MKTMSLAACTAAIALVLGGCGDSPDSPGAADNPVPLYDWDEGAAMQALLSGTLELREGCLYVTGQYEGDDEPYATVAVFPRAYADWDDETETLLYGAEQFSLGDHIEAGGGGVEYVDNDEAAPGTAGDGFTDSTDVPVGCDLGEDAWPFYIQDDDIRPMSERDF